jgi:hypothetical protein
MSKQTNETPATDSPPWLTPAFVALGISAGLLIRFATTLGPASNPAPLGVALGAFALFAAASFALIFDPARWREQAVFALGLGLVEAGLAWHLAHAGRPGGDYAPVAAVALGLIAVPLFQSRAHKLRLAVDPAEAHGHAWTDAISAAGALAFLGASWIALGVTSELFALLKMTFVKDAMGSETFALCFSGAALGAALSTLREQRRVVATLQLVAMTVLSLLALPLAVTLVVFLGAMVVSGPEVLWAATRSATPVLMGSAIGAFLLANAVLRDRDADLPSNRLVRLAGLVLALGILPLAMFAAVSMGTRVAQHGLSPERLWALVAIALACAWGLAWWVAAARGRLAGWPLAARRANVHMAFVALGVAALLALPLFDFGAISTRNQLARLEGGKVSPADFDYAALRWDFGPAGRKALAALQSDPRVGDRARSALAETSRSYRPVLSAAERQERLGKVAFRPDTPELRAAMADYLLRNPGPCTSPCTLLARRETGAFVLVEGGLVLPLRLNNGTLLAPPEVAPAIPRGSETDRPRSVEIRTVSREQVFVDGLPVGQPLD